MRWLRRWWLIPLVALLGLLIKGLLLAGMVSGSLSTAVTGALPAGVAYDGISGIGADAAHITLSGPASQEAAAVAAAKDVDGVQSVKYLVTEEDIEPDLDPEPEVAEEPEPEAPELKPAQLTLAAAAGSAIVLDGVVADDATKAAINDEAVAQYGADNVTDNLTVDSDVFTNDGGQIVLTGEAASQSERDDWFAKGTAVAAQGNLEVIDQITIKSIDETLNGIFSLEPIQFDTSRATIRPESQSTLDAAADVINENPEAGNLLVVGHTDSRGSDEANRALSQARADSVVAYLVDEKGVDAARLSSEGRGESELKVDPEATEEDLQANRRIEWEVAQ